MPAFGRSALLSAFVVAATTTVASAQNASKGTCSIDENSPSQLAIADLDLASAAGGTPDVASAKLKDAIKRLDQVGDKNPNGHALVLGKTLVLWLAQPNVGLTPTRGSLGFATNPDQTIDLLHTIDSAFVLVENVSPDCAETVAPWRQQKPWVDMLQGAIDAANNQKLDSAEVLANRSLQLYRGSPYAYMVLGQVAAQKGNTPSALQNFQLAADNAKDTSTADTRRQALLELGDVATRAAGQPSVAAAQKADYLAKAQAAYQALADDPGATQYADQIRKGLAAVAVAKGDSAALRNSYAAQLANPSGFDYQSLMQAGVTAYSTNQFRDATTLFEAASKLNPYNRDMLYNLSLAYVKDSAFDKVPALGHRLISVDPANAGDYGLLAYAYANLNKRYEARSKATKVPAIEKAYSDSARMSIDSALKYNAISDSLPAQVAFTSFSPGRADVQLSGEVANKTNKPTTYTLQIDFLDKDGTVVHSQTVTVGPVGANGTAPFSATATGATIQAFRYTIKPNP